MWTRMNSKTVVKTKSLSQTTSSHLKKQSVVARMYLYSRAVAFRTVPWHQSPMMQTAMSDLSRAAVRAVHYKFPVILRYLASFCKLHTIAGHRRPIILGNPRTGSVVFYGFDNCFGDDISLDVESEDTFERGINSLLHDTVIWRASPAEIEREVIRDAKASALALLFAEYEVF